ncbi:MAG: transglutaminase family protein [Novosphingobium sp.]
MKYQVSHVTTVEYATAVRLAQFNIRLRPAAWPGQTVSDYALLIDPPPWTRTDAEGAYVVNESKLRLRAPIHALRVESRFAVDVAPPMIDYAQVSAPSVAQTRERALTLPKLTSTSPASYLFASPIAVPEPEITAWTGQILDDGMSVLDAGRALMRAIYDRFRYDPDATATDTPPIAAFRQRRGVCQDFAQIMIVAARSWGIPAAYVSGYLRTLPPPGRSRLVGADAMHAWANLWCGDELGWIGFDPTNNVFAQTDHIFVAMGRDYSDVAPLDGVFHGGADQVMDYAVDVLPIH